MFSLSYKIRKITDINKFTFRGLTAFSPPLTPSRSRAPAAAEAAASFVHIYILFAVLRAGQDGRLRTVAGEAVWKRVDGGLWRRKGWETSGSQTPTKTGIVRLADGLTGLSWNGSLARSGYDVRGSVCCLALTSRRSLWRTCSDTVCASSRNGCFLDARNTSGGVHPGGGVEE